MLAVIIGSTVYAIEETQGFIDFYVIPTKNDEHRHMLNIVYEAFWHGTRAIMRQGSTIGMLRQRGYHDYAEQLRVEIRESILRFQQENRQEALEMLKQWGYWV